MIEAARHSCTPAFRGEIYEYGGKLNLQNGYAVKGLFDISRSKYLIKPFQSVHNLQKRVTVILKAVQTAGTLIAEIATLYRIENDPGDTLWLMQDDKFIATFLAGRFLPLLKSVKEIAPMLEAAGRFGVKRDEIILPNMTVMMGGLNEGNVQSFSWRFVKIDEAWMAGSNGLIRQAKERSAAYPHTSHILIVSQAGTEGDDLDLEWESSNMQEWAWQCPACGKHQVFEMSVKRDDGSWAGMKWDTNEQTRPNGRWNYPAVGATARLECFYCGHQVEDGPANRRRLDDTHTYIAANPAADPTIDGFWWPQIANQDISFASFVSKYLKAKEQDEKHGYRLPLVEFYQKQLARPWNPNTSADVHRVSWEPYDVTQEWLEELFRFLTIDCQKDFREFWAVVRAWGKDGESRQLARRRLESWDELAALQADWKVQDQRVFVDCGYEQTRVAQECVKHGHVGVVGGRKRWLCWTALKGARQEVFTHMDLKRKVSEKRIFSPMDYLTPNIGQTGDSYRCPFFAWSNLNVKDILRRHRDGEVAKFLSLPDTAPPSDIWSYTNQMNSEIRVKERDENGKMISVWKPAVRRPNHYWDCEAMQITAALICGVIGEHKATE